jgi:hypothetical protein
VLRRRRSLRRPRAALLSPGQQTTRAGSLARDRQAHRLAGQPRGGAARFPAPALQHSNAVDLTRLGSSDGRLTALALCRVHTAPEHHAQVVSRLRSIPRGGKLLALALRADRHDLPRGPRGQEVGSDGRRVPWAQASAGRRSGTSGRQMGHADLPWAFSDAAVLCRRHTPAGQTSLARVETTQGQGNALTLLAQT